MKILVLCYDIPFPQDNGTRIGIYTMLDALCKEHFCDVIATDYEGGAQRANDLEKKLGNCAVIKIIEENSSIRKNIYRVKAILTGKPAPMLSYYNKKFAKYVKKTVETNQYDLVICCNVATAYYFKQANKLKKMLFLEDCMTLRYGHFERSVGKGGKKRIYYKIARKAFNKFESKLYNKFDLIKMINKNDEARIKEMNPKNNTFTIPLQIGEEYFYDKADAGDKKTIFISGKLNDDAIKYGFIDFVKKAYTVLENEVEGIRINVLGGKDIPAEIYTLCEGKNIILKEWAENYKEFAQKSDIAVFTDTHGTGMKNRVGQAMAMGQAVVATSNALDGYEYTQGVNAICEDDFSKMASHIINLIDDNNKRENIKIEAQTFARYNHSKDVICKKWLAIAIKIMQGENL